MLSRTSTSDLAAGTRARRSNGDLSACFCAVWMLATAASMAAAQPANNPARPAPTPAPSSSAPAEPATPPKSVREPAENYAKIPVPDLIAKLGKLSPGEPVGYFRLGEEVAEERQVPGARQLAARLFVLAYHLDSHAPQQLGIAHSSALALAALASTQPEKRWLRALAAQVDLSDPDPAAQLGRMRVEPTPVSERAAVQIASALGYIRAGEGRRAMTLLNRPGNWAVVEEFEGILESGGAARVRSLADQWTSCPECHNRRVVTAAPAQRGGSPTVSLCKTCEGIPGPKLSNGELIGQLRLEVSLLRGIQRGWAAQLLADGGDPLRDPTPRELAIRYRVNVDAVLFRDGRWIEDPSRVKPAPKSPTPAAPDATPAPPAQPPAETPKNSG